MKKILLYVSALFLLLCLSVTVSAATNTTKTTITTLTEKAEGKVYLSWSKKTVDGYQVRWAPNSKMTGAKTASFTETEMYRSGLIGGRTYYFQVRTYKKINGKKVYSNWSPMRSIKLRKIPPATTISSLTSLSSSSFEVTWKKKANVKGYQIRYSTDSSFKTKKTASTTGNYMKRKNLTKGTYYVSVRSYNVAADGTKYYSKWSGMKSVVLQEDLQKVFKAAAGHYTALRLAGYWIDEFTLNKDGTFIGYYQQGHENKSGKLNGVPYSVIIGYTDYKGQFRVKRQINKYTYELELVSFSCNDKPYIDGTVLRKPEKIDLAHYNKIYMCIPGTPYNQLPDLYKAGNPSSSSLKKYMISFDDYMVFLQ